MIRGALKIAMVAGEASGDLLAKTNFREEGRQRIGWLDRSRTNIS